MPATPRLIAHLDMDAFYASCELLRYPELKGSAVVIGGGRNAQPILRADGTHEFATLRSYAGRGVVTTSTYEARAFGVHSAMGMMKAAALAPDAVLLPVDFDQYRHFSRLFKAAVRDIAPVVEDRGIDEIYIDMTDLPGVWNDRGRAMASRLKAAVHAATGLTCSIAVAPNKLLAKVGSELDKPDGLTLLSEADVETRIWPLAAKKVNGIGPKATEKLAAMGIGTIGEVAAADPQLLIDRFGQSFGAWLHEASHGRDDRSVVTYSEPKSISRETTFSRDLHAVRDKPALTEIFTNLCVKLAADLDRKGYAAKTIGLKLRFDDFKTVTRDLTLPVHTMDAATIRRAAGTCLKRVPLERRLRLIGVRAGALVKLSDLVTSPTSGADEADAAATQAGAIRASPGTRAERASNAGELPLFDAPPHEPA